MYKAKEDLTKRFTIACRFASCWTYALWLLQIYTNVLPMLHSLRQACNIKYEDEGDTKDIFPLNMFLFMKWEHHIV